MSDGMDSPTDSPARYNRRQLLRLALAAAAASAGGGVLAACGGGGGGEAPTAAVPAAGGARPTAAPTMVSTRAPAPGSAAASPTLAATSPAPAIEGKIPSGSPDVPDAYTKFPTPYKANIPTPGRGGKVTTYQIAYSPAPTPRGENKYWQELEKRLGATLEPSFGPAGPQYEEKFATLVAGGDLPDLTFLAPPPGVGKLLQQGAFTDLTPYLTGEALNEFPNLAVFSPRVWKNVAFKGKIYGVPRPNKIVPNALIYRQDWADKVGVARPGNADDFSRMVVAWTKNDPDGNGQPDTFGLGGNGPADFCITTINNIFRVPNGWRLNPDGTLVNALETDEFRQGITFARRLHEAGAYHPDTATMTNQQAKDAFTGGKIGAWYDNANLSVGGQRDTLRENNPASKVAALIPPGFDGGKGFASNSTGYFGYVATPAKVGRDRERVKELLRLLNYFAAPFGSEEYVFLRYGLPGVHYDIKDGEPVSTAAGKADIVDLRNLSNPPEVFYLPKPGDAEYLQNVMKELVPLGIDNPTQTLFSAAAAAKSSELTQLDRDRRTAIITGREPLGALDGWIRDWRSRGGDEIRKEYEQDLKGQ